MNFSNRLGVCSWSMQPKSLAELLGYLKTIGIQRLQIALEPARNDPKDWENFADQCETAGIHIVSGMFETKGEDYSTLETIKATGGILPDETWTDNWERAQEIAEIASGNGINLVTFHAGFLPHEPSDPGFEKMLHRMRLVADVFAAKKIDLALETGQETAQTLKEFLQHLGRTNVGVNFDPANMILYDKGNPIEALRVLGPYLKQCHIKDAKRTKVPGSWGEEVPTGAGEVDWEEFFRVIEELKFGGYFCIEREAGNQRLADIRAGRDFLQEKIFSE